MPKRYFVMLAHVLNPRKHQTAGAMVSEKLEGMRAFWDGGVSRGVRKNDVPYANTDKDDRLLNDQIATGLWTRLGNVIHAPDWWLDKLPAIPLDGELYIGRDQWQRLMSIVKDFEPSPDWDEVTYNCFDMPSPDTIFADGQVTYSHKQEKYFFKVLDWYNERAKLEYRPKRTTPFRSTYFLLQKYLDNNVAIAHRQTYLPYGEAALEAIDILTRDYVAAGGEGCMIRNPDSVWLPHRCHTIVKSKTAEDAEGTVIGYTTGRQTDRGSKLLGKMGALILDFRGKRLELSGFTDAERELTWTDGPGHEMDPESWAALNPGLEVPSWIQAKHFPRGSEVSFTYRSLSDDNIPIEARYRRRK